MPTSGDLAGMHGGKERDQHQRMDHVDRIGPAPEGGRRAPSQNMRDRAAAGGEHQDRDPEKWWREIFQFRMTGNKGDECNHQRDHGRLRGAAADHLRQAAPPEFVNQRAKKESVDATRQRPGESLAHPELREARQHKDSGKREDRRHGHPHGAPGRREAHGREDQIGEELRADRPGRSVPCLVGMQSE